MASAIVERPEQLAEALRAHRPDVVFADLGDAPEAVLDLLDTELDR